MAHGPDAPHAQAAPLQPSALPGLHVWAPHLNPQETPLHVETEPAGLGHAAHRVPQVATSAFDAQTPAQSCWPAGQAHVPCVQVRPLPAAPQPVASATSFP